MTEVCTRCGRVAPDQASDAFKHWEAWDVPGDTVICPDCITPYEKIAMAEGELDIHDADESESSTER